MGEAERCLCQRHGFPRWCRLGTDDGADMSAVSCGCTFDSGIEILPYLLPMVSRAVLPSSDACADV